MVNPKIQEVEAAKILSKRAARVAVLCPGPSLPLFKDQPGYDLRIGVNRAAEAFHCDFWVALDVHTAGICSPMGGPVVVCNSGAYLRMCKQFPYVENLRHLSPRQFQLEPRDNTRIAWPSFSATVALVLASKLGARTIDCFGVDWQGEADFDGFTSERNHRNEQRWLREREIWTQVTEALARRSISVRRIAEDVAVPGK